ncbi:LPS translocon maturation chaperone LptM [Sulfuriferula plumbiphila]|nr:lipoprotein [Sulfuriferula plumbiphila]
MPHRTLSYCAACLLLLMLSACGTKGALYLPEKPAPAQPAAK